MTAARYAVVAIGNAIVDIIGRCDEAFLDRHGAAKGSMRLVDAETVQQLYSEMGPAIEISGGSAANTMVGVASFGGKAAFIGKVAGDEFGRIFRHDIGAAGVDFSTAPVNGKAPTSRSLILVTPDGERTMNTFLGISTDLDHGEVDAATVESAQIVYLEGYLFDQPQAKAAFRQAVAIAGKAGRTVALTLSDGFCVERHRDEFLDLIRGGVGILFANESEITSLYQTPSFAEAARRAAADTRLAVLTRSARGSVIIADGKTHEIPVEPVAQVVDTTGAGDLYAAGFLYGLSSIGARPQTNLGELARTRGLIP
ncbi:MAG: adenosine kinase [Hyphomicrobium sp.]|nr:adenosine kinase [Hyphomicrobium sp.]